MMKYLDGEEQLTQEELERLLDQAIAQELFIPVFVGSTIIEQGIQGIMEDVATYFPSPRHHGRFMLANGEETMVDEEGEPAAFVFKTLSDPFVGRLSYFKVISGVLQPGMELINARTGKKDRLGHLYVMMGKEANDVKSAKAGDIIVVPKLTDTRTGDTLSLSGDLAIDPLPLPMPQYPVAIEAVNKKEEDKLGAFLARAAENDPTLSIDRSEETHQTIITAMGEAQVETLLARCKEQTNVETRLVPVRIPYRETIRKTAEAQGRHKKQTGGAGQFGDCWLRLEPNPGGGYEFLDEIVGGKIPRSYIPAVDKGVQEAMREGFLAGYPMVDVKCAVFDGSYHAVDSNEMAFKTAARKGIQKGVKEAKPCLLEPIMEIAITVPSEFMGDINGDLNSRRGRLLGMDAVGGGRQVIRALVPEAEILRYSTELRSMTQGRGSYELKFSHYDEVPDLVAKEIVAAYEKTRSGEEED